MVAIAGRRPIPHFCKALLSHGTRRRLPDVSVCGSTATAACSSSPRGAMSEMGEFSAEDVEISSGCVEGDGEGPAACSRTNDEFLPGSLLVLLLGWLAPGRWRRPVCS